jgi:DNA polymerase-3 subunit delta'
MNPDDRLPWHESAWRSLARARSGGAMPHALLLRGAQGLGKGRFARRLAAALLCPTPDDSGDACGRCDACRQTTAGSHPDLLWAVPEEAGRAIKIDAVRELIAKSALAAQPAAYRVCLIEPADALNRASANALLKTLEEPTAQTVLLLVSSHPDRLPATIRSRCQLVTFRIPGPEAASQWLAAAVASDRIDACLRIAGGAPLRALEAAREDWIEADARLGQDLSALGARQVNPLDVVEKWQKRSIPSVTAGLKRICHALALWRSGLDGEAGGADLQRLAEHIDLRGLFGFVDALADAERAAANNANETMMLEHLVNRWLELTRPGGR